MAKKSYRRRNGRSIGLATTIGAVAVAGGVLTGKYDMASEIGAVMRGEKQATELLPMIGENAKFNLPLIVAAIALPAIAKRVLPNPTIFAGKRMRLKAI